MHPVKFFILSIIIVLPIFMSGQSLNNKAGKKFSVGLSFSPDYAYRSIYTKNDLSYLYNLRNKLEEPRLSYTTGIIVKYQFNTKFSMESGVQFADKGFKDEGTTDDFDVLDIMSTEDPSIPQKYTFIYRHHYLGIPLKLNYYFLQGKINMFFTIGSSLDFFLDGKNKTTLKIDDRILKESYDLEGNYNNVSFVGLTGLGIEADISSYFTFRFEPVFRYSLTPDIDNIKQHFYSVGANMALFYKF